MQWQSTLLYYSLGLILLALAIVCTRRSWRWLWGVGVLLLGWLLALPHGF